MTSTWHFFHILSHKRHKTDHQMSHAAMTVLLCRFHKTKEVRETVRIQLLMPPPPKQQLRKKETFQYWNSAWQPPSEIWLQCSTVTSISSLLGIVIYLSKRGQGRGRRRERESFHTHLHFLRLLTWLMKQLTQWLTPVHQVTKKSPKGPEMARYWFPLFPRSIPISPAISLWQFAYSLGLLYKIKKSEQETCPVMYK